MRRLALLVLTAFMGGLAGAGGTYILMRESSPPAAAKKPPPSRPPADMVDSEHGLAACRAAVSKEMLGGPYRMLAAYDTTAGAYADWSGVRSDQIGAAGNFVLEKLKAGRDIPLTVCYFDTDKPFSVRVTPPHRARMLVDQFGGSFTESIGNRDSFEVRRPGDGPYHP